MVCRDGCRLKKRTGLKGVEMADREVMQQALEALETHAKQYPHMVKGYTQDAVAALRARLAEPEPEPTNDLPPMPDPVAWQVIDRLGKERSAPLFAEWQMRSYARVAVDLATPPARPLTPAQEAAPELLEALQYVIAQVPEFATVPGIRDAIAKAEGGCHD